jgi:hypothetical protein
MNLIAINKERRGTKKDGMQLGKTMQGNQNPQRENHHIKWNSSEKQLANQKITLFDLKESPQRKNHHIKTLCCPCLLSRLMWLSV